MIRGLLGRKVGMMQVFSEKGEAIPVTVIRVGPCVVTQIRTSERDGYEAVQIGFEEVPARKLTRPQQGHLTSLPKRKAWKKPPPETDVPKSGMLMRHLREFQADNITEHSVGDIVRVDIFAAGQHVDVVGDSKGRGFAGVVKRHGFRGGPKTHGQSDRHRAPGSIGGGTSPSRVWKGQRMAGRMGGKRVTIQSLEIVDVIPDENLLLVRGAIPGPRNGMVHVKPAVKR
jgi:large subunit ribosomal protein L3